MEKFKELLLKELSFPCSYTFKFVVPETGKEKVETLLEHCEISERPSKNGKYISFTGVKIVKSVEEVLFIYEQASTIEGVISL